MGERGGERFFDTHSSYPSTAISENASSLFCDSNPRGSSQIWVNDDFTGDNAKPVDEVLPRNDSFNSSKSVNDSDFETSAPGKPYHSLLAVEGENLQRNDLAKVVDDDESTSGTDGDFLDTVTGRRPKFEHQNSNIAEIVEQSGSSPISKVEDIEEIMVPTVSEDALAAGAWTIPKNEMALQTVEEEAEYEFMATSYLRQRLKHVFILSTAGKPIYSRYGNEEELSSMMGVMQALVSFTSSNSEDELISIRAATWTCVFMHRPPLILVAASSMSDSYAQLKQLLYAVHQQIFSILTSSQLTKIFENRNNFDLRRLLTGTERSFQSLINLTETNASLFLNAVKIHPMKAEVREAIGQAVAHYAGKFKQHLVFAIVVANDQLVTIARMKRYTLHPSDLHLIINMVAANPSFKNAESWSPLCLPIFDKTGFLHAHISYLNDDCKACLLLLTVDRTAFFALSDVKRKIVEKLDKSKMLPQLSDCISRRHSFRLTEVGVHDLWHFLYKNQVGHQFTCPAFDAPFTNPAAQKRLFATYLKVHHRMHTSGQSLKIMYTSGESEAVLGWVTSNFELYAVFAPLTPKAVAVGKVDRLMKWLKKEENQLFVMNPPLY